MLIGHIHWQRRQATDGWQSTKRNVFLDHYLHWFVFTIAIVISSRWFWLLTIFRYRTRILYMLFFTLSMTLFCTGLDDFALHYVAYVFGWFGYLFVCHIWSLFVHATQTTSTETETCKLLTTFVGFVVHLCFSLSLSLFPLSNPNKDVHLSLLLIDLLILPIIFWFVFIRLFINLEWKFAKWLVYSTIACNHISSKSKLTSLISLFAIACFPWSK